MPYHLLYVILFMIVLSTETLLPAAGNQANITAARYATFYTKAQFAGNLGLFSVGIGNEFFNKKLSVDINYGYTPKNINGALIHTFAIKPAFHFNEFTISGIYADCYIGTAANYNITKNTFPKLPDYYPDGYYLPNAFHSNPFIGTRIRIPGNIKILRNLSLYAELGSVDYKIWYFIKNKKIKLNEILNLCFGLENHIKLRLN
jgi:hypothetical protein